jgi:hypothetical protein
MGICLKSFAPSFLGCSKPVFRPGSLAPPVPFRSQVEQRYDGGHRQFWRFSSAILSNKFAELAWCFAVKNC